MDHLWIYFMLVHYWTHCPKKTLSSLSLYHIFNNNCLFMLRHIWGFNVSLICHCSIVCQRAIFIWHEEFRERPNKCTCPLFSAWWFSAHITRYGIIWHVFVNSYGSVLDWIYAGNKGNNKITELRTILQRESQNSKLYKQTKSVNNRKTVKTVTILTWYRHF
jgi:hypothetical protein